MAFELLLRYTCLLYTSSINIASAYLQVLFNEELHRVSLGQVELSKEQCNRIERLAEVGKASPAEVAEAKARVAQDEMNAVQTGNNYQLALLDLSQLIELETPKGFLLENPAVTIELIPLASPDEIYQLALGCKAVSYTHLMNKKCEKQREYKQTCIFYKHFLFSWD